MQLDFAGVLGPADGRYLARCGEGERVLVLETLGAPPGPPRRRRPRSLGSPPPPPTVPLARATVVRAFEPFDGETEAHGWLEAVAADDERLDKLLADAVRLLNGALHAHAVAAESIAREELRADRALAARIGYGAGDEVAAGRFSAAYEVEPATVPGPWRRRRRDDEIGSQRRVAAVLSGRERLDACETLLLRARADLDAGRAREAALQLRIGLEALLAELSGGLSDPGHERDIETLRERQREAVAVAAAALRDELDAASRATVADLLAIAERVLRRRRILNL